MDEKNPLKIPVEVSLPNTIEGCHELIHRLLGSISELFKRVEKLEIENRELKERLNNNSSNSSLPPSIDFKKKKQKKPASKNKSGGQNGHKGHFRKLLESEKVDEIIHCKLPPQCSCGGKIDSREDFQRHQVYELPPINLHVTEYRLEKGCCADCGRNQVGTVFNKQKIVNAALEMPTAELLAAARQSPCLNTDETGHNRDGKKQWMWGFVSSTAAYFSVQASRGKKVLKALIGDFNNILVSDRYAAYNHFDSSHRQICWAHLKRDFTRLSEKEDKVVARIGKNLLMCEAELFKVWHAYRENTITRDELQRKAYPLTQRVGELLEQGTYTDPKSKVVRFCKNLLNSFNALWTFLSTEQVEPHEQSCGAMFKACCYMAKKLFWYPLGLWL